MMKIRFVPLATALVVTISLTACKTAPMMPMGSAAAAPGMAKHDHMAMMDAQMKTMQGMHDKMMAAKSPDERSKLMAELPPGMRLSPPLPPTPRVATNLTRQNSP